ncbi:hypothetical protein NU195Hw_g3939t1 [Hortaea werneckii]
MAQAPSIDLLLSVAADKPSAALDQLRAHPELASKQDAHGYSLVHAATSWNHLELLQSLIQEFNVDPNITDEDGETALFNAESIEMAKELLRLGVKLDSQNTEGQTAAEKLDDPDEQPEVAVFLREAMQHSGSAEAGASVAAQTGGAEASVEAQAGTVEGAQNAEVHPPPPLPDGVKINVGTMQPDEMGGEPDPEFRRRIEELAQRDDFQTEEGQRELEKLVREALSGLPHDDNGPASTRRRVE